jgi:23S rRNA (guanosine2251-2'-O)-methyltransferase
MSQVEGRNPVYETLKRGGVKRIMISESSRNEERIRDIISLSKQRKVPIEYLARDRLDKASNGRRHQGVIALINAPGYVSIRNILDRASKDACFIILDGIQDPQNLGTILRTADATKVEAVLIPKREGVGLTPTVQRVSMGGAGNVPVAKENLYPAIKMLKDEGFKLIAIDPSGSVDYWDTDLTEAVSFVFGSEGAGISPVLLDKCDRVVKIPMLGHVSSLNVGASMAVIMYERLHQLKEKAAK